MIEQITAFRTSDGRVFNDKAQAYHAEVVSLYGRLPQTAKRGFSLLELRKLLGEIRSWLAAARSVHEQMRSDPDCTCAKVFNGMIMQIGKWAKDAEGLLAEHDDEADSSVKGRVARQGS